MSLLAFDLNDESVKRVICAPCFAVKSLSSLDTIESSYSA
jgi:hypothetical protein